MCNLDTLGTITSYTCGGLIRLPAGNASALSFPLDVGARLKVSIRATDGRFATYVRGDSGTYAADGALGPDLPLSTAQTLFEFPADAAADPAVFDLAEHSFLEVHAVGASATLELLFILATGYDQEVPDGWKPGGRDEFVKRAEADTLITQGTGDVLDVVIQADYMFRVSGSNTQVDLTATVNLDGAQTARIYVGPDTLPFAEQHAYQALAGPDDAGKLVLEVSIKGRSLTEGNWYVNVLCDPRCTVEFEMGISDSFGTIVSITSLVFTVTSFIVVALYVRSKMKRFRAAKAAYVEQFPEAACPGSTLDVLLTNADQFLRLRSVISPGAAKPGEATAAAAAAAAPPPPPPPAAAAPSDAQAPPPPPPP